MVGKQVKKPARSESGPACALDGLLAPS